jgi:hypothetical protein
VGGVRFSILSARVIILYMLNGVTGQKIWASKTQRWKLHYLSDDPSRRFIASSLRRK